MSGDSASEGFPVYAIGEGGEPDVFMGRVRDGVLVVAGRGALPRGVRLRQSGPVVFVGELPDVIEAPDFQGDAPDPMGFIYTPKVDGG